MCRCRPGCSRQAPGLPDLPADNSPCWSTGLRRIDTAGCVHQWQQTPAEELGASALADQFNSKQLQAEQHRRVLLLCRQATHLLPAQHARCSMSHTQQPGPRRCSCVAWLRASASAGRRGGSRPVLHGQAAGLQPGAQERRVPVHLRRPGSSCPAGVPRITSFPRSHSSTMFDPGVQESNSCLRQLCCW